MGNLLSAFESIFSGKKPRRILLVGLDAAGKTTILYKLRLGELVVTIPTIGFNVETVAYKNINFTIWDIGGQEKIRALWRHYYNGVDGIIFVIDSNDSERLKEAADTLQTMLAEELLSDAVLLVLANKQDLPRALPVSKVTESLGLYGLKSRRWNVQACVAATGDGLYEGLDWLSRELNR
eukprot:TRINITY_DN22407_c0_g1_i1.p1 TRINITY_DN22407_c0_g1~~TRINITY_DN22407_c0_g1_i1.p1  ORF type:complete len:204 (-),score=52.17 TRINITY_DN22407_c0_g1_i1:70-609(-)